MTRRSEKPGSEPAPDDIHVLIADDHRMIAEALRATLLEHGGFRVSLSETLDGTLGTLRANGKDRVLVMLDITMPGMQGLRSVKRVIDAVPNGSVVLFSGTSDGDFVWRAIDLGAKGFVSKSQQLRSLPTTLQLIHDGNEFVPMSLPRRDAAKKASDASLSDTDLFILRAVAEGKTNKEIALEIDRSEVAVKMRMRTICQRLNARNRAHAVIVASKANLL
ncbi:response regulator transcription factor [Salibaculum halophilum]|uniref:response regulator transcription factor n=1 Tax=Salibaculum halophilum TaxID=1914408 RepID=UPI001FE74E28|nr:response regulator transcription factor [Salibaculum halophilum]